jgi:hypothetical protein
MHLIHSEYVGSAVFAVRRYAVHRAQYAAKMIALSTPELDSVPSYIVTQMQKLMQRLGARVVVGALPVDTQRAGC